MSEKLLGQMPMVQGTATVNKTNALNKDIIQQLHENFQIGHKIVAGVAEKFRGKNARATAFRVWKFLRMAIKYKRDSEKSQDIRLPNRFVRDQKGDCKSYSLFAGSILASLGLPVYFRYASYSSNETPTHVYITTRDETGKEIIVDGVYNHFDKEKLPTFKKEYKMQIRTLGGLGDQYLNGLGDVNSIEGIDGIGKLKLKKLLKAAVKAGNPLHHLKVGLKAFKKVGLSVPRKAFQTLVALNLRGVASKLKLAPKDKIAKVWKRLGGNPNSLYKSINNGAKRKPKLIGKKGKAKLRAKGATLRGFYGLDEIVYTPLNGTYGIGDGGISAGALLASAAAILGAFAGILKSVKTNKNGEAAQPGEDTSATDYNATLDASAAAGGDTRFPPGAVVTDSESGAGSGSGVASEEDLASEVKEANANDRQPNPESSGFSLSPTMKVVVFGGGAVVLAKMLKIF